MNIIAYTPERLVVQEQLWGIWLLSLCTALIGFFMFMVFESPVDWFGGGCMAMASLMGVLTPTETCTFDLNQDSVTFTRQHWLKQYRWKHSIAEIRAVQVKHHRIAGTTFYRVILVLAGGQQRPISVSATTDSQRQQVIANQIDQFLRVKLPR
ncbi:hypothetical protein GS597_11160 [Synechococcales cyanobacterium C]|uniref:Uncharacterized protein n=1 Tax=Petrachloros mirabilis ULC683 TaxID=2781853 RepID=A0A8K2A8L0_9CYAN|nr:hypothetical protein [Petrachloros mirabilis]NCJ07055.1 hypothetical protein [Petrachloros mirabilis ULC683]